MKEGDWKWTVWIYKQMYLWRDVAEEVFHVSVVTLDFKKVDTHKSSFCERSYCLDTAL